MPHLSPAPVSAWMISSWPCPAEALTLQRLPERAGHRKGRVSERVPDLGSTPSSALSDLSVPSWGQLQTRKDRL